MAKELHGATLVPQKQLDHTKCSPFIIIKNLFCTSSYFSMKLKKIGGPA